MNVAVYASLGHYADHLSPIADELEARGVSVARWAPWGACEWGTPPKRLGGADGPIEAVIVAGFADMSAPAAQGRLVYVEHGAGQGYGGAAPGADLARASLARTALVIAPGEACAARWRGVGRRAVAVGCPRLDRWHRDLSTAPAATAGGRRTVAVTFHWQCDLLPETRSAWTFYDRALHDLVVWARRHDVELLGHGHPRLWGRIKRRWLQLGVEPVADLADVFARADVLVGDNTSALYEFASLRRPVVVLNAPFYRRDVEHGLRFWSAVPGLQVDDPGDLVAAVAAHVDDRLLGQAEREQAVAVAYAACDGHAARRAADAIVEVVGGEPQGTEVEAAAQRRR